MRIQQQTRKAFRQRDFDDCPPEFFFECMAYYQVNQQQAKINNINYKHSSNLESVVPDINWSDYNFFGAFSSEQFNQLKPFKSEPKGIEQLGGDAILLAYNDSAKRYEDLAEKYQITSTGWAWNAQFADLNNDTWQDLFIANGFLFKGKQESNFFYENKNGKYFENKTDSMGFKNYLPSSSFTFADYDLDGDIDIILAPSFNSINLYENQLNNSYSIAFSIDLEDDLTNLIGTKILIEYGDGKKQLKEICLSGGFKSFNNPSLYFGLGKKDEVSKVKIIWSNGSVTQIDAPFKANFIYNIKKLTQNELNS